MDLITGQWLWRGHVHVCGHKRSRSESALGLHLLAVALALVYATAGAVERETMVRNLVLCKAEHAARCALAVGHAKTIVVTATRPVDL